MIKWVTTKDDEDSDKTKEENVKQYSRLMASLAQCEWIESKTKLVQDMNKVEAKNYDQLYDDIKVSIHRTCKSYRNLPSFFSTVRL